MGAIESIWFVFWRMALRVFVLLTVLGTTYGVLVGGLTFPYGIGLMISGPIFGAIAGLGLGVLEGLVLGVVAVLVHRGGAPGDFLRYRRMADLRSCASGCRTRASIRSLGRHREVVPLLAVLGETL